MKVNSIYCNNPTFNAIKVKHIESIMKSGDITFYNNATAKLDKPCDIFTGAKFLIEAYIKIEKERIFSILDILDASRLEKMLIFMPRNLFKGRSLLGVVGTGLNTTALQLDNNEVLCLTDDFEVFQSRNFEEFDLPMKQMGQYEGFYDNGWYIRELGEPVNQKELNELERHLNKKGYIVDDWRTEQACKLNGKIYLLDFECAKKPSED